ncbi:MAG: hypothetical protein UHH87_10960, partial [Akkermansia sp.]|nr:hypothetical protein [Akkermansia sp.]
MADLDDFQNERKAAAERRRRRRAAKERLVLYRNIGSWWKRMLVRAAIVLGVCVLTMSVLGYALFTSVTAKYQK